MPTPRMTFVPRCGRTLRQMTFGKCEAAGARLECRSFRDICSIRKPGPSAIRSV